MLTPRGHERTEATTRAWRDYAPEQGRGTRRGNHPVVQLKASAPTVAEPETTELPGTDTDTDTDTTGIADLNAAVSGAQRGDSDSFRVLYRDTQPRLMRYLTYLVGSDAEDIASETWLQATRDLHSFQGNHENFRGWITTIARHRALDHLRRHSRQPAVPVPIEDLDMFAAADDTADRAIESITTDGALQLIAVLPRDQAEAVLLRAVIGLDARTAASITGKRAGAVRTAAYRGLRTLAKHLATDGNYPENRVNQTRARGT